MYNNKMVGFLMSMVCIFFVQDISATLSITSSSEILLNGTYVVTSSKIIIPAGEEIIPDTEKYTFTVVGPDGKSVPVTPQASFPNSVAVAFKMLGIYSVSVHGEVSTRSIKEPNKTYMLKDDGGPTSLKCGIKLYTTDTLSQKISLSNKITLTVFALDAEDKGVKNIGIGFALSSNPANKGSLSSTFEKTDGNGKVKVTFTSDGFSMASYTITVSSVYSVAGNLIYNFTTPAGTIIETASFKGVKILVYIGYVIGKNGYTSYPGMEDLSPDGVYTHTNVPPKEEDYTVTAWTSTPLPWPGFNVRGEVSKVSVAPVEPGNTVNIDVPTRKNNNCKNKFLKEYIC
ncbi:MAG: Ig-like domain-containing protein [Candidatus Firestonebacteria bacterium]